MITSERYEREIHCIEHEFNAHENGDHISFDHSSENTYGK